MNKKVLSLLFLGSLTLAACSGDGTTETSSQAEGSDTTAEAPEGAVEILFLNGFTGGDGAFMKRK